MKSIRVLQIGSDRSRRGILFPHTQAAKRQQAYAELFGSVDIIAFSRRADGTQPYILDELRVYPTNSPNKLLYGWDAWHILRSIPKPNIISVQDPFETGLLGLLFSKVVQVPLLVQVHTDFLSTEYRKSSLLNRLRALIAPFVLRRATRIRVVSDRIRDSLQAAGCGLQAITVLPMFVPTELFKNAVVPEELARKFALFTHRLLFVGRFEPEKNAALALESFAQSAPQNACLIMVGDGSDRTRLERIAYDVGVKDRVFFEGLTDAAPYYQLADLLLVTSRYEGFGVVIIEALASGTPVLSTDVGIAREAGALVSAPESYARSLQEWFKDGARTGTLAPGFNVSADTHMKLFKDHVEQAAAHN